jgi:AcrR family transcriptional regulator
VTRGVAQQGGSTDGRVLRSERSRELIAGALYELVGEGHPEPTAQQVAERAGVGIRTVFRLFSDMEALYATMNARLLAEIRPILRDGPPEAADLGERVTSLVADRAALFERVAPYLRATNLQRGRSSFLTQEHRAIVGQLRARLLRWLPELTDAPADLVEALDQATSFEAWDRLRSDQRLGRTRARAAMERAVSALVRDLENDR